MTPFKDHALIGKYDVPAPRYTSYPTALQFKPAEDPTALAAEVSTGAGPLSLYFHLPFCESLCWFCACSSIITGDHGKADPYIGALETEMDLYLPQLRAGRLVEQVHLGGGSPDFFTPVQLERLCKALAARFCLAKDAELSAELEPRILSAEHVDVLAAAGFTRASIGVQDSDPAVQKAVHRVQPPELNFRALEWLRARGFSSVNVDVMYGLPLQTEASFSRTIDHILALAPDRVAVFNYAHVPWMKPAQKNLLLAGVLPTGAEKIALFSLAAEKLVQAGYVHIGLDHFARPGDELARAFAAGTMQRNFQGYSTRAGAEMLGFGVTSISQTLRSYRQNVHSLEAYYRILAGGRLPVERGVLLSDEDLLRRKVIMAVMCASRLDYAELSRNTGVDFPRHFSAELAGMGDLEADGLLFRRENSLEITPAGRLLVRAIALRFDAYYKPAEKRHSKAL